MCLAIPSKVVEIKDQVAIVDVQGAQREANLMLMPDDVAIGDYVLVHAGFAIQKVDKAAALDALQLINEMIEQMEAEGIELGPGEDYSDHCAPPTMPNLNMDD